MVLLPKAKIMKRYLLFIILLFTVSSSAQEYREIHCKHFFYGIPKGTPITNDLIIRDNYALSSNDQTKFADWVCYVLDNDTVSGDVQTERKWKADPWLFDNETLEPPDYKGIGELLKSDRGHQAPLASFKGTKSWADTNYLSNITPQKSELNQGAWKRLEDWERELVCAGNTVYVITGPLYEQEMEPLPYADEPHKIPSGYWKIIVLPAPEIKVFSYIFPQNTPRDAKFEDYACSVDEIEKRTGLDFMSELTDEIEEKIEK
ncbi:MAG: DNA/RNA non-specific endonuclease [Candidatus Auribacterota bacterium]